MLQETQAALKDTLEMFDQIENIFKTGETRRRIFSLWVSFSFLEGALMLPLSGFCLSLPSLRV